MAKENQKELYCTVRTDTAYGKKVLDCVEQLKDRLGLSVSRILQDSLLAYEYATRDKEKLHVRVEAEQAGNIEEPLEQRDVEQDKKETMFSLLSAGSSEYQM